MNENIASNTLYRYLIKYLLISDEQFPFVSGSE